MTRDSVNNARSKRTAAISVSAVVIAIAVGFALDSAGVQGPWTGGFGAVVAVAVAVIIGKARGLN